MGNRERESPAQLTESWPDVASSDPDGETARLFAQNLRAAIGDRSIRSVAAATGVSDGTIRKVLAGAVWPDLLTVSRLERQLETRLYPR